MLILTRRQQESVVVGGCDGSGGTLKVTVLEVRGNSVRLGFDGPTQIAVHRLEVWQRLAAAAQGPGQPAAAQAAPNAYQSAPEQGARTPVVGTYRGAANRTSAPQPLCT